MEEKSIIVPQTSSVYWLDGGELYYTPIYQDNTFNPCGGSQVEEELVGEELLPEPIYFKDFVRCDTFGELYTALKIILQQ